ncbi:hypothetical protein [Megamonas funiformis]|uniref:hypothetical protein n=1 Tax=Megamonas funiformis TaxID=437897 RepID=UPI00195C58C1|nr:hypothetical protein [Megamonas funiformis]MBM6725692.1 hypothetical protein [Megamonas funiformis]
MKMKKYLKFMFAICVLLVPFFITSNNTGEASAVQVSQAVQDMKDNYKKSLTYSPCLKAGDSWIQTILAY